MSNYFDLLFSPVIRLTWRRLLRWSADVCIELCNSLNLDFCCAMLCISAAIAVMRCPSVCLSVTFVDHVKTNKHIFNFFSSSGSHTILVFLYQTGWRYSDGNPPNGGVECRWGIGRNRDSGVIAGYRRLLDVRKTFTDDEAEYISQSATHHWLSIDCWTRELEVTKTVTDDHAV